jgi:small subunit ribosomal protein S16
MPRDGRFIEILGSYNPILNPPEIHVDEEKVYKWLRQGAQPTDTVRSLLQSIGTWRKWSLLKRGMDIAPTETENPPHASEDEAQRSLAASLADESGDNGQRPSTATTP